MANSKNAEQKLNVTPLHDRVIVKPAKAEEKTAGGIIIPDSAKEKPQEAKVIALGTGKKGDDGKVTPFEVKVGDRVLFTSYAPQEIEIGDATVLLMSERDILAVLED